MRKIISILLTLAMILPMVAVPVKAEAKTVSSFDELKAAIENVDVAEITVSGEITADSTLEITRNIKISGGSIKSAMSSFTGADIKEGNLFYIKGDHTLTLEDITLDGDNKCRLIRAQGAKINLNNVIMKNGSTGNLQRVDNNGNNDQNYSGGAILAEDASVVTINDGSFLNNNTGTTALDGNRAAEGGAIKIDSSVITINGTKFEGNHLDGWETTGGRQGGSIEATNTTATISNATFDIVGPFNTGGAIKFENCSKATVTGSTFTIADGKKPVGMAGGAITSEGSYLTIDNSTFNTGKGSYVQESGGLIQVVGTGEFHLKNSTLNGSGVGWNATGDNKTAKYGGAIVFYDDSSVTATIENTTIQNFTAEISGGAIALNTQIGKSGGTELTLIDTKLLNNLTYAFDMSVYGGGIFVGNGNTVTMQGGQISSVQSSSVGGAIYNEGKVTLTKSKKGNAQIINNKAYHMAAGVLNDGELIVDYATFSGNAKGDWSNANQHVLNKNEMAGENIYAAKDVTITQNAQFDGKDVRIIEGKSSILLTGKLPEDRYINVSISESEKTSGKDLFQEKSKRKVGYLVAKGTEGYTPRKEDAKQIHYISKDTDPTQPIAEANDHESTGKWDFVLNKDDNTIVLGQRVKLIYHGNLGTIGSKNSDEELVDVYKTPEFWEGKDQLKEFKAANPTREKYEFMGWYYWKDQTAGDTETSVQNITKPDDFKGNLFDFSRVKFENNVENTDKIITPNIINTYAGWSKNIDLEVAKEWKKADGTDITDDNEKQSISVTLKDGDKQVGEAKTFTKDNTNYGGKFENLPVFTKSYKGDEKNMNLSFAAKVYEVKETPIYGFSTSYNPATITANAEGEKKITITNKKTSTGNVYVKYIDEYGNVLEAESAVKTNAPVGEAYTTEQKTFEGYQYSTMGTDSAAASGTVVAGDLHVVYVYKKIDKPVSKYKAIYEFKSGTEGKTLPAEIEGYKPTDATEYEDGAKVDAKDPTTKTFEDTTNKGTWTFTSWDQNSKTIDKADVKFIGTWTFAAKPDPELKSDFTVTKTVDKQIYEKAGDVLTYTVTVKNTGEKDLTRLIISDDKTTFENPTFDLAVGKEKTFTYTYTVTDEDVKAKSITNIASVKLGDDGKPKTSTTTSKLKEPKPEPYDPGYWYEPSPPYLKDEPKAKPIEEKPIEEKPIERPELNKDDHKIYMFGYPDWTFKPEGEMTRGEAAAMFARLFKEYPGDNYNYHEDFSDVDENYWCYKEIAYLAEWGIINGYEDGTFKPDNKISRAEFVKIVESFEALQTGANPYSDVTETYWAYKYIVSSSAKGWINGYLDGTFKPDNNISRSEAVKIANKLVNRYPDKDFIDRNKYLLKDFIDLPTSHWAYYEIHEAANGHIFERLANGMDERWLEVNEERFVFTPPKYHYNK